MNNSGVGWAPLPLTLQWVQGLWQVEAGKPRPPGRTCLSTNMPVRKLCQQQSRPESLGPPLPAPRGALRIDPGALPRSSPKAQSESHHCRSPELHIILTPTSPSAFPPESHIPVTTISAGPVISHCSTLAQAVPSTWTAFFLLSHCPQEVYPDSPTWKGSFPQHLVGPTLKAPSWSASSALQQGPGLQPSYGTLPFLCFTNEDTEAQGGRARLQSQVTEKQPPHMTISDLLVFSRQMS